jgi:hypothetical protein
MLIFVFSLFAPFCRQAAAKFVMKVGYCVQIHPLYITALAIVLPIGIFKDGFRRCAKQNRF